MRDALRLLSFVVTVLLAAVSSSASAAESVCVLYFDNHTGDTSWDPLKKGLADMVVSDLSGVDGLTVVERSRLEDVLGEQKLQRTNHFDPATAVKVGKLLGARYAVTGSVSAVAPKIRIDVRLIEVQSGKVVVADKVVGSPDRFFELQADLLTVFTKSLGKTLPQRASVARVDKLDTALAFGRGLDLADNGDPEAAEKALKDVVKAAPKFALGQTRYLDIMRRLQEAKAKRQTAMQSGGKTLLDKCEAELKKGPVNKLNGDALRRYLGYRILRGNLLLRSLAKVAGNASRMRAGTLPAGKQAEGKALMLAYVANTVALADELATIGRAKIPAFPKIDDDDKKAAEAFELGNNPEMHSFMSFQTIARSAASFIALGRPDLFSSVNVTITPPLATLDPAMADKATELLDKALLDIAKHERKDFLEREMTRTLDLYGEVLVALGRPVEALARWQQVLDDYPKSPAFADIEKKIRDTLEKAR